MTTPAAMAAAREIARETLYEEREDEFAAIISRHYPRIALLCSSDGCQQARLSAQVAKLRAALEEIADGTSDRIGPFRAMPGSAMQSIAREAIKD